MQYIYIYMYVCKFPCIYPSFRHVQVQYYRMLVWLFKTQHSLLRTAKTWKIWFVLYTCIRVERHTKHAHTQTWTLACFYFWLSLYLKHKTTCTHVHMSACTQTWSMSMYIHAIWLWYTQTHTWIHMYTYTIHVMCSCPIHVFWPSQQATKVRKAHSLQSFGRDLHTFIYKCVSMYAYSFILWPNWYEQGVHEHTHLHTSTHTHVYALCSRIYTLIHNILLHSVCVCVCVSLCQSYAGLLCVCVCVYVHIHTNIPSNPSRNTFMSICTHVHVCACMQRYACFPCM
jgi:hypothetical protein